MRDDSTGRPPPAPPSPLAGRPWHTAPSGAFADARVEAAFWQAVSPSLVRTTDVLVMCVAAAGSAVSIVLYPPRAVSAVGLTIWASLIAVWMLRPAAAARHRARVLPLVRVGCVVLAQANVAYHAALGAPVRAPPGRPPSWRRFIKAPQVFTLFVGGLGLVLPPAPHAAATAACAAFLVACRHASADARAALVGADLNERAAAHLARWTAGLGLGARRPLPPGAATLAVTLFLQLVVGACGGCAAHAVVVASMRRKFRDRVRGPPATRKDAALRWMEPVDAAVVAGAGMVVAGVAGWWAVVEGVAT